MWDDSDVITLTDLTETDEFREAIESLDKPPVYPEDVKAHPPRQYQGMEYALVGMAIDYLIRFEIQRRNPKAMIYTGDLVAEQAVVYEDELRSPVSDILAGAKANCTAYANGSDAVELPTRECLDLARLENLVRGGDSVIASVDRYLGESDDDLEEDLENLIDIADPILDVGRYAVLNPVLANRGVVADADLIVDDALIDMKTTINPEFTNSFWRQLVGYLVLMDIHSNLNEKTHNWTIDWPDEFGVYFSRSGDLRLLNTDPIYKHESYPDVRACIEEQL